MFEYELFQKGLQNVTARNVLLCHKRSAFCFESAKLEELLPS